MERDTEGVVSDFVSVESSNLLGRLECSEVVGGKTLHFGCACSSCWFGSPTFNLPDCFP